MNMHCDPALHSPAAPALQLDASGRVARDGEQTQIGGNDSYVAMCRRHFMVALRDGMLPDYR